MNYIKVGLDELKEIKSIFNGFKQTALTIDEVKTKGLKGTDLRELNLNLITFEFHAYSSFRSQKEFSIVKE